MKARILEKSEEKKWEDFIQNHPLVTIHQTPDWGHFQCKKFTRGAYWIVVLEENEQIIGGSMIIRHGLPKGYCWLYSARGPLIDYSSPLGLKQMKLIFQTLKTLSKKEKAIFYRIDPPISIKEKIPKFPHSHKNHLGFQPEHTLLLDLSKPEAEILAQMKPKGRYNIRLAEKKGVQIRESDPSNKEQFEKDITVFHRILHETTMRDKFYGHKKDFYRNMIQTLYPKYAKLYLAEYQNRVIAGVIATFFKDSATYYYGVSSNEDRNVMAPYLLQWNAIKEAKQRNITRYDFLGIAPPSPDNTKDHPWKGVTDFKTKFGGSTFSYQPPRDFAFSKITYWLYRLYKFLKA